MRWTTMPLSDTRQAGAPFRLIANSGRASASRKRDCRDSTDNYLYRILEQHRDGEGASRPLHPLALSQAKEPRDPQRYRVAFSDTAPLPRRARSEFVRYLTQELLLLNWRAEVSLSLSTSESLDLAIPQTFNRSSMQTNGKETEHAKS
jgi:hypothetical protein